MKEIKVRIRKDGCYEARMTVDGKQKSIYGKSISDVRKKAKELQQQLAKGEVISKCIKLNVAMQYYLENVKRSKVKPTTYDRAESTFKYHIKDESLGRKQIGTITAIDIQKLLTDQCSKGLSASSIKKIYNLLGEFFRYSVATRQITYNPMDLVEMPHVSNIMYTPKKMQVLTVDELKKVISVAEHTDKTGHPDYRYGEVIVLLLVTGLRSGEVRGIKKEDIDFDKRILHVHRNVVYAKDRTNGGIEYIIGNVKTKQSNRNIPLNDRAILALERLLATTCNHESGYLVCTSNGQIVTHSHLQRCYTAMLKKAGIQSMGLHSTRHTFATVILKDAADKGQIKEVSELLGHSEVSTTYMYYVASSNEDKRNLVNQLSGLIS